MSTYSQIYIQIVFAVKGRQSLIAPSWETTLYKYISGIVKKKEQKMLAINGMPDHLHMLVNMKPTCCLSDLIREIKKSSNSFINQNKLCRNFSWQNGFGSFSYSISDLDNVIKYIMNQKEHHKKQSFKDEYLSLLNEFEIGYDEKYLFEWIDPGEWQNFHSQYQLE